MHTLDSPAPPVRVAESDTVTRTTRAVVDRLRETPNHTGRSDAATPRKEAA